MGGPLFRHVLCCISAKLPKEEDNDEIRRVMVVQPHLLTSIPLRMTLERLRNNAGAIIVQLGPLFRTPKSHSDMIADRTCTMGGRRQGSRRRESLVS